MVAGDASDRPDPSIHRGRNSSAFRVTCRPGLGHSLDVFVAALFTSVLMPSAGLSLLLFLDLSREYAELLRQPDPLVVGRCTAARRLRRRSTSGAKAPKVCGLPPPRRVFGHSWLLRPQQSLAPGA